MSLRQYLASFVSTSLLAVAALLLAGCGAEPARESIETGVVRAALSSPTTSSEYKLPASIDPEIIDDRFTELWARVYRPSTLQDGRRYPLLVFLHGNHATCGTGSNPRIDDNIQYTTTGTCPEGYVVVPNHEGYAYLAEELAAQDYIVVSINANRGITAGAGVVGDAGLNLARGRLVLKHLVMLSEWDRGDSPTPASLGVDLMGHLDFSQLGLMGHSRGGEGMRAAYNQYRDAGSPWPARIVTPLNFRGIFEIGPVDGQTSRTLDMQDTKWSVILPMCDGDVSNLQGIRPFDRSFAFLEEDPPSFKSSLTVWGANHNYYNSEWQQSDSPGCTDHMPLFTSGPGITGSADQRETGRILMSSFFLGNIGEEPEPSQNALFDPLNPLPGELTDITRVDRGFTLSPDQDLSLRLEDFVNATGTSSFGLPNLESNIVIDHGGLPEHDPSLRGARISWSSAGADTFFQTNFTGSGAGISLEGFGTLDLRLDRAFDALNPTQSTDFTIQLVDAQDELSAPLRIADFLDLTGPVGGPFSNRHAMLQTARIPLSSFAPTTLAAIRGVRLTFDQTASGAIYVANIRATLAICPATPKLDLKIRQVSRDANQIQFRFQVFNRDSVSVSLSDLSVRLWLSDPTTNLVAQTFYGGHVFDGNGAFQFGNVSSQTSTMQIQPPCAPEQDRIADWAVTLGGNDPRALPGNGGAWVDGQFTVHRADWSPFASLDDDYSQTPAYQAGVVSDATWPTVYGDDAHFVLYYQGTPVSEFVTTTLPDPDGGAEPSCLTSCAEGIESSSTQAGAASPSGNAQLAGPVPLATTPPPGEVSQGEIVGLSPAASSPMPGAVDLVVVGDTPFGVHDSLLVLTDGDIEVTLSRYPDPSDLGQAIFTASAQQFAALQQGEPLTVIQGRKVWRLDALDETQLSP